MYSDNAIQTGNSKIILFEKYKFYNNPLIFRNNQNRVQV